MNSINCLAFIRTNSLETVFVISNIAGPFTPCATEPVKRITWISLNSTRTMLISVPPNVAFRTNDIVGLDSLRPPGRTIRIPIRRAKLNIGTAGDPNRVNIENNGDDAHYNRHGQNNAHLVS